ncbi:MAG TPA: DUF1611 domain-containing protein [Fimbriimonadaceae bacterium]|nr:DUF1611 domain-containing protein [Fimbriimonadaceae bacterium]
MSPLRPGQKIAIYMEGALGDPSGKMGYGVLRYSPNPIVCVIDSRHTGRDTEAVTGIPRPVPVVADVTEARALGAEVFLLGIAPGGGLIPPDWFPVIDEAVALGMSVVNGLHDRLGPRYALLEAGQFVWDIRIEPQGLGTGTGAARELENRRVLLVGTDMAVGKMTAGLEMWTTATAQGIDARFVATGQIGITIVGRGVPLDAVRVDYASGSIEAEVMAHSAAGLILIEGQGSLIHPGSTATLPLLRGSCPTHLVLCLRAGQEHLLRVPWVRIPPLRRFISLIEDLAEACGTFSRPTTVAVAVNTFGMPEGVAHAWVRRVTEETGLVACDPVRDGADALVQAVMG